MNDSGEVQVGTVGWTGETEVADLGTDSDQHTLVRVTLFDGRDVSLEPGDQRVASGRRVLAQIGAPAFHVPKLGTIVWVVRPAGLNCWAIVCNPTPNPTNQFKGTSRTLQDYGDDTDVVIRGKSITLQSADGHFIGIGPQTGLQFSDPVGSGARLMGGNWVLYAAQDGDAKTMLRIEPALAEIMNKSTPGTAALRVGNGVVKAAGQSFVAVTGNVALGAGATLLTPVAYMAAGVPTVSSTVYVQS